MAARDMSHNQNRRVEMRRNADTIVTEFLELFHTTTIDMPRIQAALAENARWQPVVPTAAVVEGRDRICAEIERQYRLYADCACKILNVASNGNTVFTERVDDVRMLADDRTVVTRVVGVFDLDADGRIVWWREYWDMLDIADQIGISGEDMRGLMDASVPV
jgi:limonene-1,2-epoxide hydrolase